MSEPRFIAERKLLFSLKGSEERKVLVVRVGSPRWIDEGEAACPVMWEGLIDELMDTRGIDTLHALYLAVDIDSMLEKLSEKYDFFWPTGEPYLDNMSQED